MPQLRKLLYMGGYNEHNSSMDRFIDFLGRKPEVGGVSSFSGLLGSIIIQPDMQQLILFAMQFMVLLASLVIGVLTIVGWYRKQNQIRKDNEKNETK